MRQNNRDIILRIKQQQPRLGAANDGILDSLGSFFSGDALKIADQALGSFIDTITIFNTETSKTLNTTGKLTSAFEGVTSKIKTNTDQMLWLENRNKSLQKTFFMSKKEAANFGQSIDKLTKDFNAGGKVLRAYVENLKGVSKGFAGSAKFIESTFGKQLIQVQDDLIKTMGLSEATANAWSKMAIGRGGSMDEQLKTQVAIAEAIKQSTGYQDAQREILEGMAGLTADIEMHYGRIPGSLELGILKAKQLGLSVEDMYNSGTKMLNVEETIGKEMELQALTGKRLANQKGESLINLYQQAQMNGDLEKQASIMAEIVEKMGDDIKTNPFARQVLSDLTGLGTDKLANVVREMEVMKQTPGAKDLFAKSASSVITESAGYQDTLKNQRETQGISSTESQQERERDKAETDMINKNITDAADLVEKNSDASIKLIADFGEQFKQLNDTLAGLIKPVLGGVQTADAIRDITTEFGTQLSTATFKDTSIKADNVLLSSMATEVAASTALKDGVISPGSSRILFNGAEGAISFGDNDYITASTNNPLEGGNGNIAAFANAIVTAIKQQTDALTSNSGINAPYWS